MVKGLRAFEVRVIGRRCSQGGGEVVKAWREFGGRMIVRR